MTDDLQTIQDRITKSVTREKSLNSSGALERKAETERRYAEKQKETAEFAKLKEEERRQTGETAKNDQASQEFLRQEGEIIKLSEGIQRDFVEEVRRRESVEKALREKATTLEDQLQRIKAARPA